MEGKVKRSLIFPVSRFPKNNRRDSARLYPGASTQLALHRRLVLLHQLVQNAVRNLDQFRIDLSV